MVLSTGEARQLKVKRRKKKNLLKSCFSLIK